MPAIQGMETKWKNWTNTMLERLIISLDIAPVKSNLLKLPKQFKKENKKEKNLNIVFWSWNYLIRGPGPFLIKWWAWDKKVPPIGRFWQHQLTFALMLKY